MLRSLVNIVSIIFVYCICCIFIYENNVNDTITTPSNNQTSYYDTNILGSIKIDKININHPIYDIDDPKNNVDENITILNGSILPDQENSILFIAAHSGVGDIAYFNDLDKLSKGDEVSFYYKNTEYRYIVSSIYEEEKNGYIHANKSSTKQLILTTCSKNKNKQLIVSCILK